MARPKPADMSSERAQAAIDSALRTLDAEGGGIDALAAALRDGLGSTFAAAVDLIRAAQGRVIVTGMGKSGHVGHKIASTFASTGTPALFVHPAEASHGDLGMIAEQRRDPGAVVVGRDGRAEESHRLLAPPPHRPDRDDRQCGLDAGQDRRCGAGAAAGARGLPAQSGADHLLADAARARRRAGDRAAGKPRLHRGRFRPAASRRQARRAAQSGARSHAHGRVRAAGAARHAACRMPSS